MRLWKRASGVLKDKNSLWLATLRRRTALRNPDIEAAVIKATSHDEFSLNSRHSQQIFAWVRISPNHVKPLVWAIGARMDKTRSWVVALKGLMLMHGVLCCKVPAIQRIGKLPFDLSTFKDGHSDSEYVWGYNDFIRAYYTFLDEKSSFIFLHAQEQCKSLKLRKIGDDQTSKSSSNSSSPLMQDLLSLQKMQGLLGMLLQIRPESYSMASTLSPLILDAMDGVIIEIFDVYSRICRSIAMVLTRLVLAGTAEATLALKIMRRATVQGEKLSTYFQFCKEMGVVNAKDCPEIKKIPEEDLVQLENELANKVSDKSDEKKGLDQENCKSLVVLNDLETSDRISEHEFCNSLVVLPADQANNVDEEEATKSDLKTIITNEWQVFDDEYSTNPFLKPEVGTALVVVQDANGYRNMQQQQQELPDLISF